MKKHLLIVIILCGFLRLTQPAKADPVTASVVASVIALGFVVATPFLDKDNQKGIDEIEDETEQKKEKEDETMNNDLPSRSELENLKDNLGKRWLK